MNLHQCLADHNGDRGHFFWGGGGVMISELSVLTQL